MDFGANIDAKDELNRLPYEEIQTNELARGIKPSAYITKMFEEAQTNTLRRNTKKYDEPLYVKYLTPVDHIKELADFIKRMNDMSTLKDVDEQLACGSDHDSDYSQDIDKQLRTVNIGNEMNT